MMRPRAGTRRLAELHFAPAFSISLRQLANCQLLSFFSAVNDRSNSCSLPQRDRLSNVLISVTRSQMETLNSV
jgi:hypothetical protein